MSKMKILLQKEADFRGESIDYKQQWSTTVDLLFQNNKAIVSEQRISPSSHPESPGSPASRWGQSFPTASAAIC